MSQLTLEREDLWNVPQIALPDGFILRTFQHGDEAGLGKIYEACQLGESSVEYVQKRMLGAPCYKPGRIFVVEHAGDVVATAAAWVEPVHDPGYGYLHMVGVLPEFQGKRLGAIVTCAAINYSHLEGFTVQRLKTDDWRKPAIQMYLNLGYYPVYLDPTHMGRWEAIAQELNRPEIVQHIRDMNLPMEAETD